MKRFLAFIALACLSIVCFAQKPLVINVEKLKKPDTLLPVSNYDGIWKALVLQDAHDSGYALTRQATSNFQYNIIAKSKTDGDLVYFYPGSNSFFSGMYHAYADHRPFTLSPDMMWLLICQGFANHVNNNSEKLRSMFVNFSGKTTLVVQNNNVTLDNPDSPWQEIFPEFSKQISQYTGKDLTDALTADFSTTTATTKIASQITALYAMKSYFDFVKLWIGCGIPKVTLEGTPADWQKVLDKTKMLRKYQLDWWVDKMIPILEKIVKASKGEKDKKFWQAMFKYHNINKYGSHDMIDGWMVRFFPYNEKGMRMNLDSISSGAHLPKEVIKVDLKYISGDGKGNFVDTPLELWAGFVGLKQNDKDFTLRPEISWMIRKKDTTITDKKISQLRSAAAESGIEIRVSKIPEELFKIGPIRSLSVEFIGNIEIPDELAKVKIDRLSLKGTVTSNDIKRIRKLFPKTILIINNQDVPD